MNKAVLFDFDMTLIDSSHGVTFCLNMVAERFGLEKVERPEVLKTIGYPMEEAMKMLWGAFDPSWTNHYRDHLAPFEYEKLVPFDGVRETLEKLRGNDVVMAVVSNRRRLLPALSGTGLDGFFSLAVGMEDVKVPKPDPESIHLVLQKLGVSKDSAFFVGDSEVDAIAARNAGVRFIGVTTGGRPASVLLREGAFVVVEDLSGVPGVVCPDLCDVHLAHDRGVL
jgi:HAD superfamily hydrolase (TIGR01509 family)